MFYFVAILAFLIILCVISALLLFFYWKFKKNHYTRERYAFVAIASNSALIVTLFPTVFGGSQWINLFIDVVNKILGVHLEQVNLGLSDKILFLLIVMMYMASTYAFFVRWEGKKSIRHVNEEKERDNASLFKDLKALLKNDEELKVFKPEEQIIEFDIKFPTEETIAWNLKSAMYLQLLNKQVKVNTEADWHADQKCFISKYSANGHKVAIFVSHDEASESRLNKFVDYVENFVGTAAFKYYIMVKNGAHRKKLLEIRNKSLEVRYEHEILENLIDFNDYKDFITKSYDSTEIIQGYGNTLSDIYTMPACTLRKRFVDGSIDEVKIDDIEVYISNWLNDQTQKKHLAILGEYGQGKSVLTLRLAYLIFTQKIQTDRIPIIIELRGKYPKQYSDLIKFLSDWSSKYSIDPNALYRLHMAGKLLVIFEGFDEMELVGDYSIRLDHFRKLWDFSFPNSKIIITGRPNYFLNDNELKTILKTSDTHTNLPHCEEIYINMFDTSRIKNALRKAEEDTRNDILELLSNQDTNKSFIDLISRPALLFLTSIVWKERKLNKFKKNINSAIVIEEFLKQTYERQEKKDIKTPLTSVERSYFMLGIALGMVNNSNYTNQIDSQSLRKILSTLYNSFPNDLSDSNIVKNKENKKPVKQRYEDKYNEETILLDIRSCGVLVRDLSTFDSFKFAHKSFLEYLVSFFCANSIIDFKKDLNDKIVVRTLKKCLEIDPFSIKKNPEVFRFTTQIISQRIDLSSEGSDLSKMKLVFKTVYPIKKFPFRLALLLIPVFGRDIKGSLKRLSFILGFWALIILIVGMILGFSEMFKSNSLPISSLISFILISLLFYCMPLYYEKRQQQVLSKQSTSFLYKFEKSMFNFLSDSSEHVLDIGNLNLWYQICIESGIKRESIRKEIPNYLFNELDSYYNSLLRANKV